jgi:hypothetical protein
MPAKTARAGSREEFEGTYRLLREMLRPYDARLKVTSDAPGGYMKRDARALLQG